MITAAKARPAAPRATAAPPALAPAARARPWKGEFHQLRLRLYVLLFACDLGSIGLAFLAANLVWFGDPFASYGLTTFAVLFPIYAAVGLNGGTASIEALQAPRRGVAAAIRAFCYALAVASVLFFSLKIGEDFSRFVFGFGAFLSIVLLATTRHFAGKVIGRRFDWTFRREVLLLDGIADLPLANQLAVDAAEAGLDPRAEDPQMRDRLSRVLDRCERVILACPPERRALWARMLAGANMDVEVLTPELDGLGAIGLRSHRNHASLLVGRGPLGLRARFQKRLLDIAVSALALFLLAPVLVIVALAIKLDSPGPVLFRQPRTGRGNRIFEILKFRTMRHDAADGPAVVQTSRGDGRLTAIGRLLRATSVDELPQLWNVLRGEMSIVGPRPHALGSAVADEHFWTIDRRYFNRHAIKPGMTGLAQVRGYRGAAWHRCDLTNRVHADLEYVEGWHIGRDLWIMARTLGILVHPNAF